MRIATRMLRYRTKGAGDLIDLTDDLGAVLNDMGLAEGAMTVFVVGSTAGITSFEYEPGLIRDIQELYERIAPRHKTYAHDATWGDANGYSHVRAAIQGQSMSVPFQGGRLLLGTWQQVVLAEFDTRSRDRQVVCQCIGVAGEADDKSVTQGR